MVVAAAALPGAAQAQAGDGFRLNTPGTASPAQPTTNWVTVAAGPQRPWQVDLASVVHLDDELLRYRARGTRSASGESWVAARCGDWQRADLADRDQASNPTQLRWRQPLFGDLEDAELATICERRGARSPAPPAWTEAQFMAAVGAWQHTQGPNAYELRIVDLDTEGDARRARIANWDKDRRWRVVTRRIDGLADLPPALRVPVAELYGKGERSAALRLTDRQGALHWLVIELAGTSRAVAPADRNAMLGKARRWVAQGHLPAPDQLLGDPAERARALLWAAPQAGQITSLPAGLNVDVRYGNLMTPLTQALLAGRADSARALLARGADANLCGLWGCPLALARFARDTAEGDALITELLAAGARPDQIDTHYAAASTTVLTDAVREGQTTRVERLLAAGASPDGAAGVRVTPLAIGLATGRRELAQRLLAAGASPLPWQDRDRGAYGQVRTIVDAAAESGQAGLAEWAEQTLRQAAASSPRYRWDAHIEQGGRVIPLVDGARIDLRAAPFSLVLTLPAGSDASLGLASSLNPAWADEVRRGEPGNGLFAPMMSSATVEPPQAGSYELFAYAGRPADAAPDAHWGGYMALTPPRPGEPEARVDFHAERPGPRPGERQYVREFRALFEVPEQGQGTDARPFEQLAGTTLQLALGALLPLRGWERSTLVAPRLVTLHWR